MDKQDEFETLETYDQVVRREMATELAAGILASDVQNQRPLNGVIDAAVNAADMLLERLKR